MQLTEHNLNGTPMPSRRLAAGVEGIRQTLVILRRNARAAAMMPQIRAQAEAIIGGTRGHDLAGEAQAVQAWVRANVRYTRDPRGVELVKPPVALLKSRSDDCDGHAQLVAALLASVGHSVRLVALGFAPDRFAHVVAESLIGGRWLSVETTTPAPVPVGWNPPGVAVRMVAPLSSTDAPELGFLKKIGKALKKVAKVAAPIAALTVPGAGAALTAVQAAKVSSTKASAELESARAQTAAANAQAVQAQAQAQIAALQATAPAPASSLVSFVEKNKTGVIVGGALLALLLLRPNGAAR